MTISEINIARKLCKLQELAIGMQVKSNHKAIRTVSKTISYLYLKKRNKDFYIKLHNKLTEVHHSLQNIKVNNISDKAFKAQLLVYFNDNVRKEMNSKQYCKSLFDL